MHSFPLEKVFQASDYQQNERILEYYDNLKYEVLSSSVYINRKQENIPSSETINKSFNNQWTCLETSYSTWINNWLYGIPVVFDYVPHFPHKNNRHFWTATIDATRENHLIPNYTPELAARIYRKVYSIQPVPEPTNGEYVPEFFRSPFQKNVTDSYLVVQDINIDITSPIARKNQYAYLSVFNEMQWHPIATCPGGRRHASRNSSSRETIPSLFPWNTSMEKHLRTRTLHLTTTR